MRLAENFRRCFLNAAMIAAGSQERLFQFLSKKSAQYGITYHGSRGNFHSWINGEKKDRGQLKTVNLPLWILIECSKLISQSMKIDNEMMRSAEKQIEYYCARGHSTRVMNPKLPVLITPEMISIIFHFMGDGHMGRLGTSASYRQMNRLGLNTFLKKLQNVFGDFTYGKVEYRDGKLVVPKSIAQLYVHYFKLPNTNTFTAYVPTNIKSLPKNFLLAGLLAFIVDEGSISEVITVYSKNKRLLADIRCIALRCGYLCHPIREKFGRGSLDCYRFNISSKSLGLLYADTRTLSHEFPTCTLVHKQSQLQLVMNRHLRSWKRKPINATKQEILTLLLKPRSTQQLSALLNIGNSSVREHLYALEKANKVIRVGYRGRVLMWKSAECT